MGDSHHFGDNLLHTCLDIFFLDFFRKHVSFLLNRWIEFQEEVFNVG